MILALGALALPAGVGACGTSVPSEPAGLERSTAGLEQVPLTIYSDSRTHRFIVEVARTAEEQSRGLMFRQSLAPDAGMLFPYDPPQNASFWMKNTLIPLDMLFINADGTIAHIAENTVPMSLDPVAWPEPVVAVLEIAGGRAAELGIGPGDRVGWQLPEGPGGLAPQR